MDIEDRHEIRMMVREELDERFPAKHCSECKGWQRMVAFTKYHDEKDEYVTSFKCLYCGSEFVEELRKV